MTIYEVALFVHLLGVITLFIAFGIGQRAGQRARQAESVEQLRLWMSLIQTTGTMFPSAWVMILAGGLYMTADVWSFDTPWVVVALVSVLVMAIVGFAVPGRQLREVGMAAGSADAGPLSPELKALLARPALWTVMTASNAVSLGILWLMVSKPGWVASILIVVVLAVIGAAGGSAMTKRGAVA
jgi:uncharacterized membrane protein